MMPRTKLAWLALVPFCAVGCVTQSTGTYDGALTVTLTEITDSLVREGVRLFAEAFEKLLGAVSSQRLGPSGAAACRGPGVAAAR
jgi:hypothetical protein